MRKFFIVFLFSLSNLVFAQNQSGSIANITWMLNSDGLLTISGEGNIPNNLLGTFDICKYASNIRNVVIEYGITGIEAFLLANTTEITSVSIPSSVTMIDGQAFRTCEGLNSITIHQDNPVYISHNNVIINKITNTLLLGPEGISGLYSVPDGVEIIDFAAFWMCAKLTSVNIPASVKIIDDYAFLETGLISVSISGNSLTRIGNGAFRTCVNLTYIQLPASVRQIGYYAFEECSLTSFYIPEGVTLIEEGAFGYCHSLGYISIPASVTNIENYAFADCKNLTKVVNLNPVPQIIPEETFDGIDLSACTLRVFDVTAYKNAPVWEDFGTIEPVEVDIKLDMKEIYLLKGATATLIPTVTSELLTSYTIVWESSKPNVASVCNLGVINALAVGTAVISASVFGNKALCEVTVIEPGNSAIAGTVDNAGTGNVRVNLYIKVGEKVETGKTKRGIIGGYVLLATVIPNDNGEYSFENLPEGSYKVEVEIDEYEPCVTDELPLSENETLTDIDFTVDEEEGIIIVEGDPDPDPDPDPESLTGTVETGHAASLQIYPNPFTDVVHVIVQTGHAPSLRIQVINTAGTIVYTQTITNPEETIHLGHLPAGLYIIRVENGGSLQTFKVIKIQ